MIGSLECMNGFKNNSYKKIDWSDTPVYEDKLNTNNNKLDISLEEAEKIAIDFLEHNNYN